MRVVDLELDSVIVEERQKRPLGDIRALIASIEDVGLMNPITVGADDHKLKAGFRRLTAFRQMGRDTIPANLADNLSDIIQALKAERDENTQREELPPTVMVERARELEAQEREAAKARQAAGWGDHSGVGNFPEPEKGRTSDKVGDAFGVSGKTYEHAKQIVDAAASDPETFGDLPAKMDETSVHAAHQEMKARQAKPHVTHNSGNNEWYTPPAYIEAARATMEYIDLDPASSDKANETVKAGTYYTAEMDGLAQKWAGRVWMNPPYASELIGAFCDKLVDHVRQGDVPEACVLVNNATETGWFNTLLDVASAVCLIRSRIKFIDADGNPSGAPLQGQVVIYIGPASADFEREFSTFGRVLYATW